jgi:hypothetical protein
MSTFKERYAPLVLGVNATGSLTGDMIGGFLAITAGTVTVVRADGSSVIAAFPVAAGAYYPMPFYIGANGGTVTLAGGASGVLGV